jgi:integrase
MRKLQKTQRPELNEKLKNNDKVRFLSDEEERTLLRATDSRFHSHLLLSVHTGIRMSEQYTLEWSQIDFERRQMYLPRTKNGDPRDVPLSRTALSALEQLRKEAGGSAVFPNAESPRGWFLAAVKRAGLKPYTWQCNRHTFASRLVMAGVDLHTVGELLGHRTAQMTKRYAHLSVNHEQAAVERISAVQSATKTATGRNRAPRASRN